MIMPDPSQDLDSILRRELMPGERLLWSGRPDPARLRAPFAIWFFAVPWTAFALFWEAMALLPWLGSTHTPLGIQWSFGIIFPLFGLPFIGIGLKMLSLPFKARSKAAQTIFGLTDRRIVRVTAGRKRESASVLFAQMGPIDVTADADGYGSLRIQTGTRTDSDGDKVIERFEVFAVPDVGRLEGLLLERKAEA
ncbi:hypothetical protein [Novosphingobium sp. PASSN1]|uniref:hypothetical protein n=1 Tax=Novosphingobium sp. PASSN1 TaxID=2015561 RepID=UPI000BCBD453|nr:hypothetical protein [Novosphingobium sp. PASSN1]OYU35625.1 MAG: hypothetical protein CFE35_08940 [Novosphingobium sp. PASSN1]